MNYAARRVLLCLRYGIGDLIMELPVIAALRDALPHAHITALGAFPATQLLEDSPDVDEVEQLSRWGITHRWERELAGASEAFSAWLDAADFDLFLDVHHAPPAIAQLVWSRGIRSLEADEISERDALRAGSNGVESIREGVRAGWGIPVPSGGGPEIRPREVDREFAREFLHARGLADAAPIAVSPVASLELKRWPLERLARTADELLRDSDEAALAFCGPQEDAAEDLRRLMRCGSRLVVVGPQHLLRVAALLQHCNVFVCNDTGLMHLAGAVGVPTLGIFGPTSAAVYRPPSDLVVSIGGEDIGCPYQNLDSLHPPACFPGDECLFADRGCVERPSVEQALRAVFALRERVGDRGLRRPAAQLSEPSAR